MFTYWRFATRTSGPFSVQMSETTLVELAGASSSQYPPNTSRMRCSRAGFARIDLKNALHIRRPQPSS
jgi:hypothetical protein